MAATIHDETETFHYGVILEDRRCVAQPLIAKLGIKEWCPLPDFSQSLHLQMFHEQQRPLQNEN